jgi:hypothetical protein
VTLPEATPSQGEAALPALVGNAAGVRSAKDASLAVDALSGVGTLA